MALGDERLRSIVESLLLISPDPVPVARLVEVIRIEDPQTEEDAVRTAIDGLLDTYAHPDRPMARGFRVEEVAGGLQLRTVAENAPFVRRYLAAKPQRLSKAALETLAIVAYRQPVTKPEVEAIRGVDAGAALRSLLDRDLVKIVGKKDEVGRPLIYGTTPYFLEFFSLRNLGELPTLREFHELDEASMEEVAALDGAPSVAELAQAAQFLVERDEDPDLDALDAAVKAADAAKAAAEAALDPAAPPPEAPAPSSQGSAGEAAPPAGEAAPPSEGAEADAVASAPEDEAGEDAASPPAGPTPPVEANADLAAPSPEGPGEVTPPPDGATGSASGPEAPPEDAVPPPEGTSTGSWSEGSRDGGSPPSEDSAANPRPPSEPGEEADDPPPGGKKRRG